MTRINFTKPDITTTYVGRSGTGKCIGIEIVDLSDKKCPRVTIAPINSQKKVVNCNIDIPIEDIEAFAAELLKIAGVVTFKLGDPEPAFPVTTMKAGKSELCPKDIVVGAVVDVTAKAGDEWTGMIYRADVTKIRGNVVTIEYSNEDEGDVCWEVDADQCKLSD